jgi:hypothetical protein
LPDKVAKNLLGSIKNFISTLAGSKNITRVEYNNSADISNLVLWFSGSQA